MPWPMRWTVRLHFPVAAWFSLYRSRLVVEYYSVIASDREPFDRRMGEGAHRRVGPASTRSRAQARGSNTKLFA